jgi:hypothetical protein
MTDKDLMDRYQEKVYIGRSHGARPRMLRKPTLKGAIKDAYTQAKADKEPGAPQRYRVVDIWAVGTNPIHEYIVALGPD